MSIEMPGTDDLPGAPPDVCPVCYPMLPTPATQYLCLAGIQIGDLWVPADPPPPNGITTLAISAPCTWTALANGIDFEWHPLPGADHILVTDGAGRTYYTGHPAPACQKWDANENVNPAINKYYSGWAMVTHKLPEGDFPLIEIFDLLNLLQIDASWCTPRAKSGFETVYSIQHRRNATNVKIKFDHS